VTRAHAHAHTHAHAVTREKQKKESHNVRRRVIAGGGKWAGRGAAYGIWAWGGIVEALHWSPFTPMGQLSNGKEFKGLDERRLLISGTIMAGA
jgi:hypothetical protein